MSRGKQPKVLVKVPNNITPTVNGGSLSSNKVVCSPKTIMRCDWKHPFFKEYVTVQ